MVSLVAASGYQTPQTASGYRTFSRMDFQVHAVLYLSRDGSNWKLTIEELPIFFVSLPPELQLDNFPIQFVPILEKMGHWKLPSEV